MNVTIIGTGYVGLVSGACFADFGHTVTCVDKDAAKVERLRAGEVPIYEPELDRLIAANQAVGRISFTTDPAEAVGSADVVFLAVGTPSRRGGGHADLTYVYEAAREVAALVRGYTVICTKSTVPVGTGDEVEAIVAAVAPFADVDVASNPEFLREGAAIGDFKRPDRVIVGAESSRAVAVMRELYRPLFLNETPILFTSRRTAELTKYAANAFLAAKITFINEMADLCEKVGADVQDVAKGMGLDKRIGPKFLNAGPGYGGSCFPKDTLALAATANDYATPVTLVDAVVEANARRKGRMARVIVEAAGGSLANRRVAVLGLAFKPQTDDMREAPSLVIVPALQKAGATVVAYDPEAMTEAAKVLDVPFAEGAYEAMKGADVTVILTEWNEFRALDLERVRATMRGDVLVDLRNIYSAETAGRAGLTYRSVGRTDAPLGLPAAHVTGTDLSDIQGLLKN
ncbi:UDP-glucose/GDP-mannose dehydrogenase family protein [Acuticoccus sp. I52.16.1]|uniref:UDP-glucose dehydrogenase family protein n=1 Tax=Acuticoccus sp. I52.16.1 TaxID=2928472 RepID=UPI001FD2E50F|nr:UDP-glucose/GDP-mannose dehydrogenase family protein [Acuticoccus sp. I52.16.1]UOM36244.1 UDP-glucose/GDP-mannose dehydrogenase family protein [Acuticoccus sp. I52.16.1]